MHIIIDHRRVYTDPRAYRSSAPYNLVAREMTCPPVAFRRISFLCAVAASACIGVTSTSVPAYQPPDNASPGGFGAALWSALNGCIVSDEVVVCLKSKALTALDRALAKPTFNIVEGVTLRARDGKSLVDPLQADHVALVAAKDPDHKRTLLDEIFAKRLDEFVSTRTVELNGLAEHEGEPPCPVFIPTSMTVN